MIDNVFTVLDLHVELSDYVEAGVASGPVLIRTEDGQRMEIIDIWYEGPGYELVIQVRPVIVNPG